MTNQDILNNLQVGADPELFLTKRGKFVSAVGLVPGTKANPHKVDKGAVQLDGMAAEFNIDPAKSPEEFNANIQAVLDSLKSMVGTHRLSASPTAEFGRELIEAQPLEAQELGCEPDYNAYTGLENPRPDGGADFRTGAGHIHVGWTSDADPFSEEHFKDCRMFAMQMDAYLGIPAMMFDKDVKRRSLYGDFGAFRPKPYGMEYRVLSNAWLKSPELITWVFNTTKLAFKDLLSSQRVACGNPRQYYRSINDGDYSVSAVINHFDLPTPPALKGKSDYVR